MNWFWLFVCWFSGLGCVVEFVCSCVWRCETSFGFVFAVVAFRVYCLVCGCYCGVNSVVVIRCITVG